MNINKKNKIKLAIVAILFAALSVWFVNFQKKSGRDNVIHLMAEKEVGRDERENYLKELSRTTVRKSIEKSASRRYNDAIALLDKNISQLRKSDYEKYPTIAATFLGAMAYAHSAVAGDHMEQAVQWQERCIKMYEQGGDYYKASEEMGQLGWYHLLQGDVDLAEEAHKRAVAYAELVPQENELHGKYHVAFHAKMTLLRFYLNVNMTEKAKETAGDLELMIEKKEITGYEKDDIRRIVDSKQ